LYVPWAGQFRPTGAMAAARAKGTGSALPLEGLLLAAGGDGLATSELYRFATVKTDKDDYAPGATVTITGTGWQPRETVSMTLHEIATGHPDRLLTAVADDYGAIVNSDFMPDVSHIGVRFYLTARGAGSQAQTTFTDANPQSLTVGTQTPAPIFAGNSATYSITVTFNGNTTTACTVDLTVAPTASPAWPAPPPSGFFSLGASSLTSVGAAANTTLTVTTPSAMAANTYNFTVTATPRAATCQNNPATLTGNATLQVAGAADLTATKTNNVSGSTAFPSGWTWTVTVANTGTATANFGPGRTILSDNLPSTNASYGAAGAVNLVNVGVSPELAVALTVNGASPYVLPPSAPNVIVWLALLTVTVSPQLLLPSFVSAMLPFGSTAHTPPDLGLTNEPLAVGVAVNCTWNDPPAAIMTGPPLAVQVRLFAEIAQPSGPVTFTRFTAPAAP
jgi:hypothetical protein